MSEGSNQHIRRWWPNGDFMDEAPDGGWVDWKDVRELVEQLESAEKQLSVVRDNAQRWQNHAATSDREVAALRGNLVAVIAALDLPEIEPSLLWQDSGAAILKRVEEIVDEADRGFRERDSAKEQLEAAQKAHRAILATKGYPVNYVLGLSAAALQVPYPASIPDGSNSE